jgi:hypothetical protein
MSIARPLLLVLLASCYALACTVSKPQERQQQRFPEGDYQYSGYNKRGDKIVEGRLSITSVGTQRIGSDEVTQIKGDWQLKKVGSEERIGVQEGTGELVGSLSGESVNINLNPNINDGNVILEGKIEGRRMSGKWSVHGYAGVINEGTFEGIRK